MSSFRAVASQETYVADVSLQLRNGRFDETLLELVQVAERMDFLNTIRLQERTFRHF